MTYDPNPVKLPINPPTVEDIWAAVPDRRLLGVAEMGGLPYLVWQVKRSDEIGDVELVMEMR